MDMWRTQSRGGLRRNKLVLAAVAMSAAALVITIWRLVLPFFVQDPIGPYPSFVTWNEEENALGVQLWEDIYRPMVRDGSISMRDVRTLREHAMPGGSYQTRQLAYGIMAECLDYDAKVSEAAHELIVQTHYELLSDPDDRVRLDGVAQCHGSGLLTYPQIRDAVLAMRDDPNELIAHRVRLIDWDKVGAAACDNGAN